MSDERRAIDLVQRWRQGDEEAANELYGRYLQRMLSVIGSQLPDGLQGRVDPEDVAQSAFRSVFRRLRNGEFHFADDAQLWKLLVTVALNKSRKQRRRHLAERRSVQRETYVGDAPVDERLVQGLQSQPSISEILAFRETLELLFNRLSDQDVQLIQLRLEGCSQREIAEHLDITDRTVRRKLKAIQAIASELLNREGRQGTFE